MKIAIASGKGGTGKTMVSASLAAVWPRPVLAVDLDVEEPNLHLFMKPDNLNQRDANLMVPVVDEAKCNQCGACAEICQFKAITLLGDVLIAFPEMCHGCGGCLAVCPEGAISAGSRKLGDVLWGSTPWGPLLMGKSEVGEAMSPPLMAQVQKRRDEMLAESRADVITDCPPGVSCPAMTAVADSDLIVLVTEPTPFGLYDLRLAVRAFTALSKPLVVVVNRDGVGDQEVYSFCQKENLPVVARIPYSREVAEEYARGEVIAEHSSFRKPFLEMARQFQAWDWVEVEAADG